MRLTVLLLLCSLAAPCLAASRRPTPDRQRVSRELERRTGGALNPQTPAKASAAATLPPGVTLKAELSPEEAVAIALWNNAALEEALSGLGLARADLLEAGLLRNPSFQVLFPVGPKPFESVLQWPFEALWQRPRRVAAARLNLEAVSEVLVQNGLDLVRDVLLAYADLSLAQRRAALGSEAAALRQRIAALTEKRLAAGDISEMEASLARADARAAAEVAERFARDVDAARERLRWLLGLRQDRTPLRAAPLASPPRPLPEWPQLLEKAFASRPDLRAAEVQIDAALQRARWERSRALALVAPLLSVKDVGASGLRAGPGLAAELPLFNRTQGAAARADAEVHRAAMHYAALRDQVERDIREASVRYAQAAESLARLRREVLPEIDQSIRLAQRAYEAGEVSYLFVLETSRQLYDVQFREAEAQAGLLAAQAHLERSVGTRL